MIIAFLDWHLIVIGLICFFGPVSDDSLRISLGSLALSAEFLIGVLVSGQMGLYHMEQPALNEMYFIIVLLTVMTLLQTQGQYRAPDPRGREKNILEQKEKIRSVGGSHAMANIGVIGSGSWGTALAWLLHNNGHKITLWSYLTEETEMFRQHHQNVDKLPGVVLADDVVFTCDLEESIRDKELLVLAVPSPAVRSTSRNMKAHVRPGQIIVDVAKGIEEATLMTMTDIIEEEIPQAEVAVLSGPSHAEEVGKGLPTTIVAGAHRRETAELIQSLFMNPVFRVYTSPDMLGIEIGAALKNVIALAAGIADGLGYGDNTKAALITRGIAEISRLGTAMGAHPNTFFGLSGIGDLVVTCASVHSRNRKAGYLMGKGYSMTAAMEEVHMVVEGVYSARAGLKLSEKYQIEMPIIKVVNQVLFEEKPADVAVNELMQRMKKTSWEPGKLRF